MVLINNKCVIIDDDIQITELFSELLALLGLKILAIGHNGLDAIDLFSKHEPDILFMDVEMPKLNGIEALKEIKKINSSAKVIIITGNTSSDCEKILQDNGATAIIYKPFDIQKIKQLIEHFDNPVSMYT